MNLSKLNLKKFSSKGFTLIELLIVIAILGVLAAVVLVALDPVEQLARGRDSGRENNVSQLGHALQAYYTANSAYPATAAWNTTLLNTGDIKIFPGNPGTVTAPACTGGTVVNNYCYKTNATPDVVVYTHMESKNSKRTGTCAGLDVNTWYVYSSAEGKAGFLCQVAEPAAGAVGLL